MKIIISYGFIILITTILLVTMISLGNYPESTSLGIIIGELLFAGIFMLSRGVTYDTKKRRFEEWD